MADEQQSATPGPVTAAPAAAPASDEVVAAPSKQDWAANAKAMRETMKGVDTLTRTVADLQAAVSQIAKPQPATAPTANGKAAESSASNDVAALRAEMTGLQRNLALNQFFATNQVSDAKQQELLSRALANTPPERVAAEAAEFWSTFGTKPVASQPAAQVAAAPSVPAAPIPKGSTNSPAFQMGTQQVLSGSVISFPKELVDKMSDAELKAAYKKESPRTRNPWAEAKASMAKK